MHVPVVVDVLRQNKVTDNNQQSIMIQLARPGKA